jgi:phenylalanyl-tRNA synthetase beta chain
MRVPISWLKDYVDITCSVEELAEKLTFAGLEVEKIEYIGMPPAEVVWEKDKIFVGQLLKVERHPNADRLLLATVDYSANGQSRQITVVTGAPNIKPGDSGQKVVLALVGSRLYDGHKEGNVLMTLMPAVLRGIKNDSMVCSEKELGLSEEHEGILILPDSAPVGAPLQDYLGDAVLEVAILPNTARCASIIGIAREVAALTGQKVRYPDLSYTETDTPVGHFASIKINDAKLNPRFTAGVIQNITCGPSPFWLQHRLKLMGQRPISNIVDISNYVMFEWGQPTHTFDFDLIQNNGKAFVQTRLAHANEKLVTLDGRLRDLQPTDIVVADETRAIGLAAVMGGANTEVNDNTKTVLLEVASWNQTFVRRTARHHDLHSEASFRFARGVHPDIAFKALKRGLQLMQQVGGGTIAKGIIDVYPHPRVEPIITFDPAECKRILGIEIPLADITQILESLEFKVAQTAHSSLLTVTSPNYRLDIEHKYDLIEEVGRIYGYQRVPLTLLPDEVPPAHPNPQVVFEDRVKDILVNAGLNEIVSYRFTTPQQERRTYAPGTPADDLAYVTIINPIAPDRSVMRHTLVAGGLEALSSNLRHHDRVALFEVGAVYLPSEEENGILPDEKPRLLVVMAGAREERNWRGADTSPMDFYDMKGVIEGLLKGIHASAIRFEPTSHPSYYPGRTAAIVVKNQQVGVFGELHPMVASEWGFVKQTVLMADIDLPALRTLSAERASASDISTFPASYEDLAVVVNEDVTAAQIEQTIRRAGGNLLRHVQLFDVYRGEQIGAGKKSLAYALTYQAEDRTLSTADTEKARNKIVRAIEGQLGGTIR